jgi:hypothetical protein
MDEQDQSIEPAGHEEKTAAAERPSRRAGGSKHRDNASFSVKSAE